MSEGPMRYEGNPPLTRHTSGRRARDPYARLRRIDGRHPLKRAVPGAYVDYAARRRRGAEVAWFNFPLAREMGLIPRNHPERLNRELRKAILDAFALVIINEHDLLQRVRIPERERRPHRYMATRYLQLQHPGRQGRTSGDGRSLWNGTVRQGGVTWDVTSCGTGVTCLCPATAESKQFYRTGSSHASYGCGTAGLDEGLSAALMSEIFHQNGIATERVLAVLTLPRGRAIIVRAGRNLLRPSHFFVHLKQGDLASLRASVDLFIDRQVGNGDWPALRGAARRYDFFARELARTFARLSATLESEYIFCWLDWDGDNVLANGGIIDYGSVRQFGLYHREYRFDDGPRWSTTLPEQRRKARNLVQCFAQIRDFLLSGKKSPLASYRRDRAVRLFDAEFAAERRRRLLTGTGLPEHCVEALLRHDPDVVERFRRAHAYFERARAARGPCRVPDGLSWNAIFSTRDLLRELPTHYRVEPRPIPAARFLEIAATDYASSRDRALTPHRRRVASSFQRAYLDLIRRAARRARRPLRSLVREVETRASAINARDRITGDGIDYATARLLRHRRKLSRERLQDVVRCFIAQQDRSPRSTRREPTPRSENARRLLDRLLGDIGEFRHGL